ncbi:MAG: class I SAM-dependent methyltransferase [Myxococcaceae bacterium]|nr:class I SAM-dependent methyltransferase [Myxococcaceae bacterium]
MHDAIHTAHDELSDRHWWLVGRRAIFRETLRRHLPKNGSERRILDAGCGTGPNIAMLTEFGTVWGVEASPLALEAARRRVGTSAHVSLGTLPGLGLEPELMFDVITLFDVLEHLDEPVSALGELRARLAPGGRLLVTVPAFQFLWSVHDEQNQHRLRYDLRTLTTQLSQAGLTVDFWSYYNSLLFPAVAAVRLARRVFPGNPTKPELEASQGIANGLLTRLFSAERHVVTRRSIPFGVSLLAMTRARSSRG